MAYDGDDPTGLVGEQLNTVAFVMDCVEFKFNGPVLRALTNPVIEGGGVRLQRAHDGIEPQGDAVFPVTNCRPSALGLSIDAPRNAR